MIRLEGVSKHFAAPDGSSTIAVDDVSLQIAPGETLCLIGTSGCGKTTTLRLINRLEEPDAGRVLIGGREASAVDPIRLRRGIGYVIQSGGLFPHLTVGANVGLLCELEGWSRDRRRRRVGELLDLVELPPADFAARLPAELSGGQRQRVGLARALALDPPILLMDEPFGALDPITRRQIRDEFRQFERSLQKTVVIVTHDLAEAFALGDRVALMDRGRIVQVGGETELLGQPANDFVRDFVAEHAVAARNGGTSP